MGEAMGTPGSQETNKAGDPRVTECRRGPSWRGWVLSILVAVLLSVTATLLLGGYEAFRSDCAFRPGSGHDGSGAGSGICPHTGAGK